MRACSRLACLALVWLAGPAAALTNSTTTHLFGHVGNVGGTNGVLISPNWVLTAAHVATGVNLDPMNPPSFSSGAGVAAIDARYYFEFPLQPIVNGVPANDIALLHLSGPGLAAATPFPILNSRPIDDNVVATLAANQLNTVTLTDSVNATTRRTGTATLLEAQASYQTFTVNWLVTGGDTHVEGGDSGGGLFFDSPADSAGAYLLGLASASLREDVPNAPFFSAYTQVAAYRGWIDSTLQGNYPGQAAQWGATPVAEPNTVWMLLAGLAMLAAPLSLRGGAFRVMTLAGSRRPPADSL